jgi:hypothetical protein
MFITQNKQRPYGKTNANHLLGFGTGVQTLTLVDWPTQQLNIHTQIVLLLHKRCTSIYYTYALAGEVEKFNEGNKGFRQDCTIHVSSYC